MAEEQAPIAAEGNAPEPAPVAEIKVRRQRTSISAIERGLTHACAFCFDARPQAFIGGLAWEVTDETLFAEFEKYSILSANVARHRDSGRSRGFGFVNFETKEGRDKAIEELHEKEVGASVPDIASATRAEAVATESDARIRLFVRREPQVFGRTITVAPATPREGGGRGRGGYRGRGRGGYRGRGRGGYGGGGYGGDR